MPESVRRCRALALTALALPALLLASPAHALYGASLVLTSTHGEAYTCRATVRGRDNNLLIKQSDYLRVDWWGAQFAFGDDGVLPVAAHGDTPGFGSLTLTCWAPAENWPGTQPPAGTPSYSLTLDYLDPAWRTISADGSHFTPTLPRDDRTLDLRIKRTADLQHMFEITDASLRLWPVVSAGDITYGAGMHRHLSLD